MAPAHGIECAKLWLLSKAIHEQEGAIRHGLLPQSAWTWPRAFFRFTELTRSRRRRSHGRRGATQSGSSSFFSKTPTMPGWHRGMRDLALLGARDCSKFGHRSPADACELREALCEARKESDANDAEAICEAVTRPTMRFVAIKSRRTAGGALDAPWTRDLPGQAAHPGREHDPRRARLSSASISHVGIERVHLTHRKAESSMVQRRWRYPRKRPRSCPDAVATSIRHASAGSSNIDRALLQRWHRSNEAVAAACDHPRRWAHRRLCPRSLSHRSPASSARVASLQPGLASRHARTPAAAKNASGRITKMRATDIIRKLLIRRHDVAGQMRKAKSKPESVDPRCDRSPGAKAGSHWSALSRSPTRPRVPSGPS